MTVSHFPIILLLAKMKVLSVDHCDWCSREQSRDREREKDKKRDREEDEEEAYERRKLERKLREKEAAYQEVVTVWAFFYNIVFCI